MSKSRKLLIAFGWWLGFVTAWVVIAGFLHLPVLANFACGLFVGFVGASIGMAKAGYI